MDRNNEQLIQDKFDRDKKKIWEQKLKEQYGVERTATPKKRPFYKLYIAASFLVLLAVSVYFITSNATPDHLLAVNDHLEDLTVISKQRFRGDNATDLQIEKAGQYYRDKQFDESIVILQQIIASGKTMGTAYYDLAVCYLQKPSPEPGQAIAFLKLSESFNGPKEETTWMLSLAYLKDGQKDKGIEGLSEIADKKMYKSSEAGKLLDLLLD